ncbi:MAG: hypothetical protein Q9214_002393, partial [Letrouitia sp. 1 TL-2023]
MASAGLFDTHLAESTVKTLVNAQLKNILKKEGLLVSGVKAALQDRIIARLQAYASNQDLLGMNQLKAHILGLEMHPSPSISRVQQDPSRSSPPQNVYPQVHTPVRPGATFGQSMPSPAAGSVN